VRVWVEKVAVLLGAVLLPVRAPWG
jgi:hypothetical protein